MEFIDYIEEKKKVIDYINIKYEGIKAFYPGVYKFLFFHCFTNFVDEIQYMFNKKLIYPSTHRDYIVYLRDVESRDNYLITSYKNKELLNKFIQLYINNK